MEDAAYFNNGHRPYYLPYRNPYPFPYYEQCYFAAQPRPESVASTDIKFIGRYLNYVKYIAYIQMAQICLPVFSLTLGFISLAASLAPSQAFFKILAIVLLSSSIPNFIQPKQTVFLTTALEAIEVSRAVDKSAWKGSPEDSAGMIRSEMHNKLSRLLAVSVSPGRASSLGVQDLSSLPTDLLTMMQYLLTTYAVCTFVQLLVYGFLLFIILRLLAEQ